MKNILLFALLLMPCITKCQLYKLNKNIELDTLKVWLTYDIVEEEIKQSIDTLFENIIPEFNETSSYVIVHDSIKNGNYIHFTFGEINYLNAEKRFLIYSLDIILIAGHLYFLGSFTIPLLFIVPATNNQIIIDNSPYLFNRNKKIKFGIRSVNFLQNKEKQTIKFIDEFDDQMIHFFERIDKRNRKNI